MRREGGFTLVCFVERVALRLGSRPAYPPKAKRIVCFLCQLKCATHSQTAKSSLGLCFLCLKERLRPIVLCKVTNFLPHNKVFRPKISNFADNTTGHLAFRLLNSSISFQKRT